MERVLRVGEEEIGPRLEQHADIESLAATIIGGGPASEVVGQVKLRRVLLLQGNQPGRRDIAVARINGIHEHHRQEADWFRRVQSGSHPYHYFIGSEDRHGTNGKEAYVDLLSIGNIEKPTILKLAGRLNEDEMRTVSERMIQALEIDVSGFLEGLLPED